MTEKSLNKPAIIVIEEKVALVIADSAAISDAAAACFEACCEPYFGDAVYLKVPAVVPDNFGGEYAPVGGEFCDNMNISFHLSTSVLPLLRLKEAASARLVPAEESYGVNNMVILCVHTAQRKIAGGESAADDVKAETAAQRIYCKIQFTVVVPF